MARNTTKFKKTSNFKLILLSVLVILLALATYSVSSGKFDFNILKKASDVDQICLPFETERRSCRVDGCNGTQSRRCNAYGTRWGSWSACEKNNPNCNWEEKPVSCSRCGTANPSIKYNCECYPDGRVANCVNWGTCPYGCKQINPYTADCSQPVSTCSKCFKRTNSDGTITYAYRTTSTGANGATTTDVTKCSTVKLGETPPTKCVQLSTCSADCR